MSPTTLRPAFDGRAWQGDETCNIYKKHHLSTPATITCPLIFFFHLFFSPPPLPPLALLLHPAPARSQPSRGSPQPHPTIIRNRMVPTAGAPGGEHRLNGLAHERSREGNRNRLPPRPASNTHPRSHTHARTPTTPPPILTGEGAAAHAAGADDFLKPTASGRWGDDVVVECAFFWGGMGGRRPRRGGTRPHARALTPPTRNPTRSRPA